MSASEQKTVLVVDDDRGVLIALEKRLRCDGFRVRLATNGRQALEQLAEEPADAVLLDLHLPGELDGLQVAFKLHEDPATANLPIIFLTGEPGEHFKEECRFVRVKYFVTKPYDPDVLIQLIRSAFGVDALSEMQRIAGAKRRQPVRT